MIDFAQRCVKPQVTAHPPVADSSKEGTRETSVHARCGVAGARDPLRGGCFGRRLRRPTSTGAHAAVTASAFEAASSQSGVETLRSHHRRVGHRPHVGGARSAPVGRRRVDAARILGGRRRVGPRDGGGARLGQGAAHAQRDGLGESSTSPPADVKSERRAPAAQLTRSHAHHHDRAARQRRSRCLHSPPAFVHMWTDVDGTSRLDESTLRGFGRAERGGRCRPAVDAAVPREVSAVLFAALPVGWVGQWHPSPHPQWVIPLRGRWFLETQDGSRVEMGPGDVHFGQDTDRPRSTGRRVTSPAPSATSRACRC